MTYKDHDTGVYDLYDKEYNGLYCDYEDDLFDNELDHFWQSKVYNKSYFRQYDNKSFKYFDSSNFFKFLFFHWVRKWASYLSKGYVEPYKLHPLPVQDQVLHWQPIFSKHVSDGLVRMEKYELMKSCSPKVDKKHSPYRSILIRALMLTFWKRTLFLLLGIVLTNIFSMSIAILVRWFLNSLNDNEYSFIKMFFLLFAIIVLQVFDGLLFENFNFYLYRLIHMIQYCFSITLFQNGLTYRRNFCNDVGGYNTLEVCNKVLHSCSPDSECSKNPLFCPARRYQNKDITPRIFSFEFIDSYFISLFVESLFNIVNFLSSFICGIILMSVQIKVNMWVLYLVGLLFIVLMVCVEIFNTYLLKYIYIIKDRRISKSNEIIYGLPVINKMLYDDIAINIITECRNKELDLIVVRLFLTFLNRSLYIICINLSFYILKSYFVDSINNVSIISEIDTAAFLSSIYIYLKIIDSMFLIPHAIKRITTSFTSYKRVKKFNRKCSPNFYICDNKFTGSTRTSLSVDEATKDLEKDVVVLYKDASFSWVSSLKYNLSCYRDSPVLRNVNFKLKRGEIAIVTGSQGSGKSNFIKSVLGELTLVRGSMAVVPLYTSMPIFYASQDIWLQQGTIRSNITFGYKYDEECYNQVIKAVELVSDISTWEHGDLRVVSDNGFCLSGGQRVRMEMARAIYAYMIFSKVNKEYNNGKCSFLMCLDSPFQGLDPFVCKTVFSNLFNLNTGVLLKSDLSVVLSSSKRSLDKCFTKHDLDNFPDIPIYSVKTESLYYYSNLCGFISNNKGQEQPRKSLPAPGGSCQLSSFNSEMHSLCSSGANTRAGRRDVTRFKYKYFFEPSRTDSYMVKFKPYMLYFSASGICFFVFLLLTIILTIMDNMKLLFASNLSDYINRNINDFNDGNPVDLFAIRSHSNYILKVVSFFISSIIVLSVLSTFFLTYSCITSSRRFHEYCINSVFNNSSSVIAIKKFTGQIITFLSCDIFQIDEGLGYSISTCLVSLIELIIHLITLFYLVPLSIPFILFCLITIYKSVFLHYVSSSKYLQIESLESISHINTVCESGISGSSIHRSFKKEWEFMQNLVEHTDYHIRCRFLNKSILSWSTVVCNWAFSCTTLFILVVPLFLDRYTKFNMNVGYFGLALSLCMNVIKTFTKFSLSVARLEVYMCSIQRFKSFIPTGSKCVFEKPINIHEEYLPVNPTEMLHRQDKDLLRRRDFEFKFENDRFLFINKLFFRPKINLVDVTNYLTPKHVGVELKNVYVHTSPNSENPNTVILKNFNASAKASDIIGIIGRTGAGKTTLLSVLENIMRNRTGQVLLDGTDLNDIPKRIARQIIGVLPQLPFVFKGWTVRRFLDPRRLFSDNEINEALHKCGLLEFVNDLQGGKRLDSVIIGEDADLNYKTEPASPIPTTNISKSFKSERTLTVDTLRTYYEDNDMLLSSSQLRTLAFARLVLYRFYYRIIVIDEPPSEYSPHDFHELDVVDHIGIPVCELLHNYFKHCTSFIAAHDANVLTNCTSVWVLHKGTLLRTCKKEDIGADESISSIIEHIVKNSVA